MTKTTPWGGFLSYLGLRLPVVGWQLFLPEILSDRRIILLWIEDDLPGLIALRQRCRGVSRPVIVTGG